MNYNQKEKNIKTCITYIISNIGGYKLNTSNNRIHDIIDIMSKGDKVVGCVLYKNSYNSDKVIDNNYKTVILTTYIDTSRNIIDNFRSLLFTSDFREQFHNYFDEYLKNISNDYKLKIHITGKLPDRKPTFVTNDHILIKVTMKIRKNEKELMAENVVEKIMSQGIESDVLEEVFV